MANPTGDFVFCVCNVLNDKIMKRLKLIICLCAGLWLLTACADFLEEKSQDEVVPSTVTDFREIMLCYLPTGFSEALLVMDDDVMVDESQYRGTDDNTAALPIEFFFTWQPDMWETTSTLASQYLEIYESIMAMNAVLEGIGEAEGDATEREIVRAQALGARAYFYFVLVNMFGEPYNHDKDALGVVLKLESSYKDEGMPRNTVSEVYDQILEDLETASDILNNYPKQRGDFLMNSTAADILLSRVYLYMERWEDAAEAAGRAIGSAEGLLDYKTLPVGEEFYMTTYDNPEVEWIFGRTIFSSTLLEVSNDLSLRYDDNDRRKEFLLAEVNGIGKIKPQGSGPNIMVRTAEAYLNRAEARVLSATPDLAGALSDLNELRRYRITEYKDVSITDASVLLSEIREERRLELCFEGHRWFDLRRYGMPAISHDFRTKLTDPLLRYTLREEDPLYTLPIPNVVLENNMHIEQNPSALASMRVGVPVE